MLRDSFQADSRRFFNHESLQAFAQFSCQIIICADIPNTLLFSFQISYFHILSSIASQNRCCCSIDQRDGIINIFLDNHFRSTACSQLGSRLIGYNLHRKICNIGIKCFHLVSIVSNRISFNSCHHAVTSHIIILIALHQFKLCRFVKIRNQIAGLNCTCRSILRCTDIESNRSIRVLGQFECYQACAFFTIYECSELVFNNNLVQQHFRVSQITLLKCHDTVLATCCRIVKGFNIQVCGHGRIYGKVLSIFFLMQ